MGRILLYGLLLTGSLGLLVLYFIESSSQQAAQPNILSLVARLLLTLSCIIWLGHGVRQYKKSHRKGSLRHET